MLVLVGEFRGVREETVTRRDKSVVTRKDGSPWVRREARLLVGEGGDYVQSVELVGKDLTGEGWLPEVGEMLALEISVDTRVSEDGKRVFRTYKAWRRLPLHEAAYRESQQPVGA
jgi:hypothetical protein